MAHSGKTITFATDLLPNENNVYNLGSSSQKWKIFGDITGNIHWDNVTNKPLTLTASTIGFTIAGGTTSKTLTVNESITLKAGTSTYLAYYNGANILQSHALAHFSDEFGSSVKDKKNELVLGNGTAKASNGSAYGQLALYSSGTKGTYLKSAENSTTWYTAILPAMDGMIAILKSSTAKGSDTKPVKVAVTGEIQECSTYAGGTAVTLNGTGKGASTASFYAPTEAGTSGYVLKSQGSGEPEWRQEYQVIIEDWT